MPEPRLCHASAPGKAVLSGEYAVLLGAPAVVAAVNRRAVVTLASPVAGVAPDQIQLRAQGYAVADSTGTLAELLANPDWAATARLLEHLGNPSSTGSAGSALSGYRLTMDTRALYHQGIKLGLGSSAAVAVAVTAARSAADNKAPASLGSQLAAHNHAHQSTGSGVDVAASLAGGVSCYRTATDQAPAQLTAQPLPAGLLLRFVWPGQAAATPTLVASFRDWQRHDPKSKPVLERLTAAAETAATGLAGSADAAVSAVAQWGRHLAEFADHAGLPLLAGGHAALLALARPLPVAYKPCGAGAGDIGMVVATDPEALATFCQRAATTGAHILELEIDPHGVQVTH